MRASEHSSGVLGVVSARRLRDRGTGTHLEALAFVSLVSSSFWRSRIGGLLAWALGDRFGGRWAATLTWRDVRETEAVGGAMEVGQGLGIGGCGSGRWNNAASTCHVSRDMGGHIRTEFLQLIMPEIPETPETPESLLEKKYILILSIQVGLM